MVTLRHLLLILLTFNFIDLKAQDKDPWMSYMMPGKPHALLQNLEGEWETRVNFWTTGKGEAQKFLLDCSISMDLGGRFLKMRQSGLMADMPFEAVSYLGYDNAAEKFTLTVLNSMGTGTLTLRGDWTIVEKEVSLTGELVNPVTRKAIMIRQVIRFNDDKSFTIENFDRDDEGKEVRTVLYEFKRKKG
jgi:hypothetical protein